jgi:prolyl-tRNA editing enzyme YbaK/EbsC (Cys-tRNA(Pro) deacylase)
MLWLSQIYKTLVLRGDNTGVFICIIPGNAELDLKKAAKVSGNKNASMVRMKEILAGIRGMQLKISPDDLIKVTESEILSLI